jgi:hypothetical protein
MSNEKKTPTREAKAAPDTEFRRENYCTFPKIRSALIADLETGRSAKESAKALGISEQTYYKYKGLICCQLGKVFTVPEEKAFLERHTHSAKPAPAKPVAKSEEKKP